MISHVFQCTLRCRLAWKLRRAPINSCAQASGFQELSKKCVWVENRTIHSGWYLKPSQFGMKRMLHIVLALWSWIFMTTFYYIVHIVPSLDKRNIFEWQETQNFKSSHKSIHLFTKFRRNLVSFYSIMQWKIMYVLQNPGFCVSSQYAACVIVWLALHWFLALYSTYLYTSILNTGRPWPPVTRSPLGTVLSWSNTLPDNVWTQLSGLSWLKTQQPVWRQSGAFVKQNSSAGWSWGYSCQVVTEPEQSHGLFYSLQPQCTVLWLQQHGVKKC